MADMRHNPLPRYVETVKHGSTATAQRPNTAGAVYWYGSVTPVNAQPGDILAINGTLSVITTPPDVGSPLAWWDFRQYDGSGQLAPRTGTDLLTILGSPGYVAGSHVLLGATGKYGKAADADKWDPETTGSLTIIAVAANDGYADGKTRWYVTHRASATSPIAGWALQRNSNSPYRLELVTRDGASSQTVTASDTPATTTFRGRGAVITPAGTHRLWGDGTTASAASTVTGSHGIAWSLVVGNTYDSNNSGVTSETKMRGVLIYNTALTNQQISDYATAAGAGTT
jgi:hypothetical protein